MKNKYLFDKNKEELLKNTELDIAEAKNIPADQLSDYSNSVSECDEIMEERKKDESNYMERMKEFLLQKIMMICIQKSRKCIENCIMRLRTRKMEQIK